MEEVTIIIPTRNRFERLLRTLDSIEKNTYEKIKVLIICDQDEETYYKLIHPSNSLLKRRKDQYQVILTDVNVEWVAGIRLGIEKAGSEFIFYGADDLIFYKDSIELAMKCFSRHFTDEIGLIKINDLLNYGVATHGLTTKKTVRMFNGFSRDYVHYYADTELTVRTFEAGKLAHCLEAIVEHEHWLNKKVKKDVTYQLTERFLEDDKRTYLRRNKTIN